MSSIPATIVSFVALPLGIIGWSIPYWEYGENGLTKAYLGLWEYCLKISFNYMESYTCIKLGKFCLYLRSSVISCVFMYLYIYLFPLVSDFFL